jgi:hypothetical protein
VETVLGREEREEKKSLLYPSSVVNVRLQFRGTTLFERPEKQTKKEPGFLPLSDETPAVI